jgi:hypothetical protein
MEPLGNDNFLDRRVRTKRFACAIIGSWQSGFVAIAGFDGQLAPRQQRLKRRIMGSRSS